MVTETLIVAIILIVLNIIFSIRPHPIMGVVISTITFFIGIFYFVTDETLPMNSPNPIFTIFVCIIAGSCLLCQYYDYKKPK